MKLASSMTLSPRYALMKSGLLAGLTVLLLAIPGHRAATPGLPFTEDFTDTDLRDDARTTADWSTEEQELQLAWEQKRTPFAPSPVSGADIHPDIRETLSVALGDVDGDGDLDLLVGNYELQRNRLYLNNGTADPWSGVSGTDITTDEHHTGSLALGDVDGDGDLDLVAGNFSGQRNRLYLNNGTADPWAGVSGTDITTDADETASVVLGDVDRDGDLDLVVGNYQSQRSRLYLNNGTADPWAGVSGTDITADAHSTLSTALGDVDGDGDLDLVVGNDSQPNRLYLNNGTANPWAGVSGVNITTDDHKSRSMALGDVDGDGDLDLVVGNESLPNRLYLNNGTADPWGGVNGVGITAESHWTYAVILGDVDGDGDLDLVAGDHNNQVNRLYLNNGSASPWAGVVGLDITSDADNTKSIALGDVDGDGDLDFVAGNWSDSHRLYANNGTADPWGGVGGTDITTDLYNTTAVALGDVDGDSDLDLVVGYAYSVNRLYLNNGTADPWAGAIGYGITDDTADVYGTMAVALGDVDGDGDLDLVAGNDSGPHRLYLNNGTANPWGGVSGTDINIATDVHYTRSVALGDVDGDGDLDLVAGNNGSRNRLYLNNGTADPWAGGGGEDIATDENATYSVALGDVDSDGDLDLVAGNWLGQRNRLYLNNGAGGFGAGSDIDTDGYNTTSVALGDIDGDGDLDLVTGNWHDPERLFLNNGTADPWAGVSPSYVNSYNDYTMSVVLSDVDGDGDLDLVAGNDDGPNILFPNNGTADPWAGVNAANIDTTATADWTWSVALGDVDGDGDLDLVAGNFGSQPNRLYLNNGTTDQWVGAGSEDITTDAVYTHWLALGDVDGDGDLDLVGANIGETNRLYLNDGTEDPWAGVSGVDITTDADVTASVALGDVDGDGDLDLVAGNYELQRNRLYLNNNTADPWGGVSGTDITTDADNTIPIALGDVDGDGDLDLVAGNHNNQSNRLYLNNGTADPWAGVSGADITSDAHNTLSLAVGDVDGDGDLDLVAGNWSQRHRLYLNNGTADPWAGVSGADISADIYETWSIALGDVDGDGDLDLVTGNYNAQRNRLYLNNGTADPWAGVSGTGITTDGHHTVFVALGDVDHDGDLDLRVGNDGQPNRLYLNNGTLDPWAGVFGIDLTADADHTWCLAQGDVDGDGEQEIVAGNGKTGIGQPNRLYQRVSLHDTGRGTAASLDVDGGTTMITNATLGAVSMLTVNTQVDYWLSNNGGGRWYLARPGEEFVFPAVGNDLRWKAEIHSLSPALSPLVDQIQVGVRNYGIAPLGDRVWEDLDGDGVQDAGEPGLASVNVELRDEVGAFVASTATDGNGDYSFGFGAATWGERYYLVFVPPTAHVLTPQDQGGSDHLDSDADPGTGATLLFALADPDDCMAWDAGMSCLSPNEPIHITMSKTTDGSDHPVLHMTDINHTERVTGYNVYRHYDPVPDPSTWPRIGLDVTDVDGGTPNVQWIDTAGDPSPTKIWYYQVTAYNHHCSVVSNEGPF